MDDLKRFSGPGFCPKCTVSPANFKYCEKDCSLGAAENKEQRSAGGLYMSTELPLGSDVPAHLHRLCRACGFEWLEQCADAVPDAADRHCMFCLRTKTEVAAMTPAVAFMEGVQGGICSDCVAHFAATLRSMGAAGTPAQPTVQ